MSIDSLPPLMKLSSPAHAGTDGKSRTGTPLAIILNTDLGAGAVS